MEWALDSLTQIVLGASVAAVCVPQGAKRKAAIMGAALGTLPDLDVFIDYGDAVTNFTYHRGFSHSLFVLIPVSLVLWTLLKRWYRPVQEAPYAWFAAIFLALITHPVLDAHTAYGTQLFWPLSSPPVSWSTIFIIDPLYTLPLLVGTLFILIKPRASISPKVLAAGVALSSVYLMWTWAAKFFVDQQVLVSTKQNQTQIFSTPTPFNSLLWRVVVLQDTHYLEGFYSLLESDQAIEFNRFKLNNDLLNQAKDLNAVKRLAWFTHGFMQSEIIEGQLVVSDIRMGFSDNYVFNHAVAELNVSQFSEIDSVLLPYQFKSQDLDFVWRTLTRKSKQN